ncbi:MAG: exodeoxyribonuclease VII large subunit [Sedimentisphaerales bacterium]|nr:exodeoxyribonuclease VII large subunit [Sedimentisphaerales bacterium]
MKNGTKIYTVSQVTTLIKTALENTLPGKLTVRGEISGWKLHSSGHCYFSLKDEGAVLPCVMWGSNLSKVKFRLENGLAVFATGYIDVYEPQGKYQFYVESMQPAGVGALQLAFEQLVKRLAAQGLFDEAHKKALPKYPQRIGILTSESGAAIHDIVDSIWNRWPCVRLYFYPVPVQGEGAAEKIASAIRDVNRRNDRLKPDVLIVGRGGGSLEDLWAFNEEVLARAIYDSKIPVISAVGHEIDTTIADLVADARASTPTKAGVVAAPDYREVLKQLSAAESQLTGEIESVIELAEQRLETLLASAVFRNPLLPVRNRQQQLDDIEGILAELLKDMLTNAKENLREIYEQVVRLEPHRLLGRKMVEVNDLRSRANAAVTALLSRAGLQITAYENRLAGLNPRAVLKRGYSITTLRQTGVVLKSAADVQVGDTLVTELAGENLIESKVTKK